jgi:hypothetical protein
VRGLHDGYSSVRGKTQLVVPAAKLQEQGYLLVPGLHKCTKPSDLQRPGMPGHRVPDSAFIADLLGESFSQRHSEPSGRTSAMLQEWLDVERKRRFGPMNTSDGNWKDAIPATGAARIERGLGGCELEGWTPDSEMIDMIQRSNARRGPDNNPWYERANTSAIGVSITRILAVQPVHCDQDRVSPFLSYLEYLGAETRWTLSFAPDTDENHKAPEYRICQAPANPVIDLSINAPDAHLAQIWHVDLDDTEDVDPAEPVEVGASELDEELDPRRGETFLRSPTSRAPASTPFPVHLNDVTEPLASSESLNAHYAFPETLPPPLPIQVEEAAPIAMEVDQDSDTTEENASPRDAQAQEDTLSTSPASPGTPKSESSARREAPVGASYPAPKARRLNVADVPVPSVTLTRFAIQAPHHIEGEESSIAPFTWESAPAPPDVSHMRLIELPDPVVMSNPRTEYWRRAASGWTIRLPGWLGHDVCKRVPVPEGLISEGCAPKRWRAYHGTNSQSLRAILKGGYLRNAPASKWDGGFETKYDGVFCSPHLPCAAGYAGWPIPENWVLREATLIVLEVSVPDCAHDNKRRLWKGGKPRHIQWLFDESEVQLSAIIFIGCTSLPNVQLGVETLFFENPNEHLEAPHPPVRADIATPDAERAGILSRTPAHLQDALVERLEELTPTVAIAETEDQVAPAPIGASPQQAPANAPPEILVDNLDDIAHTLQANPWFAAPAESVDTLRGNVAAATDPPLIVLPRPPSTGELKVELGRKIP